MAQTGSGSPEGALDLSMISLETGAPGMTSEHVEGWLDAHPEFVHDYFTRKASRSLVDSWLITNAFSGGGGGGSTSHLPYHQQHRDSDNSNASGMSSSCIP